MSNNREQFSADVDRAKRGLYKNKDDGRIYSRERGMGPGMASKRLEDRGVDVRGLVANEPNPEDLGSYKKGGKVKTAEKSNPKHKNCW